MNVLWDFVLVPCKQPGSWRGANTFEGLADVFNNLENHLKAFNEEAFKIETLLEN